MILMVRDIDRSRAASLWTLYRLRPQDYCDIYNKQKGLCAICFKMLNNPQVDHDPYLTGRKYGQVRGLLCRMCNQGIGIFLEDIRILKSAIKYIRKNRSGLQESRALRDFGTVTSPVT